MTGKGWIGVDLDGTLANYDEWVAVDVIGEPIKPMLELVKTWLLAGVEVKIFTARAAIDCECYVTKKWWTREEIISVIQDWTEKHLGLRLEVTATKDFKMIELYDDRCVAVERNTGKLLSPSPNNLVP